VTPDANSGARSRHALIARRSTTTKRAASSAINASRSFAATVEPAGTSTTSTSRAIAVNSAIVQ
jgi:hypothetical protein